MFVFVLSLLYFVLSMLRPCVRRDLLPGEATSVRVHLVPIRPGLVTFSDLFIVDIESRQVAWGGRKW